MKKFFLIIIFIGLLLSLWQCSDINPLEIEQIVSALKLPTEKPDISRNDYTSNGNFLPGYQNGKIRSDRITLEWLASTDADFLCYKIFRYDILKATITDKSTIAHIDSNLSQNTHYNYKIVTMNKSGMFKSDTIRLKTPLFQAPTNLGYQVRSSASIKLFWRNMSESANDYHIERKLSSEPVSAYQEVGTSSDTSFIDNTVTNLQQYNYRVRAYNNYESTGYSYNLNVYVNYILNTPNLYSANQVSGTRSVLVEWTEYSNAEDGFLIYRRKTGQNRQLIGTVTTNVTEYVDNDTTNSLKIDSTYYYTVRAYNVTNNDTSSYSSELSITISQGTFTYYTEDFENPLGAEWTFSSSTAFGRIQRISGDPLPHTGQYQLLMDVNTSGNYNINDAYLNIDLSGLSPTDNCYLRFYYQTYGDEPDASDAVYLSSDGVSFTNAYTLTTSNGFWTHVEINLKDFYTSQPYSSNYYIVWQQYDNFPYPSDGIGIDDIEIDIN